MFDDELVDDPLLPKVAVVAAQDHPNRLAVTFSLKYATAQRKVHVQRQQWVGCRLLAEANIGNF